MSSTKKKGIIVLVSGWAGSGKDTIGDVFVRCGFNRFSSADPLKDMTSVNYGLDRADMNLQRAKIAPILSRPVVAEDDWAADIQNKLRLHFRTADGESINPRFDYHISRGDNDKIMRWMGKPLYWTLRALLILEGQTKRAFNPGFWILHIKELKGKHRYMIVTDWRFLNELDVVKEEMQEEYDIVTIRVDVETPPPSEDVSERSLDNYKGFDYRIINKKDGLDKFHTFIENEIISKLSID